MIEINVADAISVLLQMIFISALFGLVGFIVYLRSKMIGIKKELAVSQLESKMLLAEIDKLLDEASVLKMESSDGFVKFLSDSRDWAFGYIDEVQETIKSMQEGMSSMDSQKVLEEFNKLLKFEL